MGWTDESVEQLRDGVAKRLSAARIAAEIGVSRSAVLGKAFRLGLTLAGLKVATRKPRAPRPPRTTAIQIRPGRKLSYGGEVREIVLPAAPERPSEPLPDSRLLTLDDLNLSTDCRWPFGDPRSADFRYCGALRAWPGVDSASCYCGAHTRLARSARAA